jgi:hypothetical protein
VLQRSAFVRTGAFAAVILLACAAAHAVPISEAGFAGDGVDDGLGDPCTLVANDADGDGYGNGCDPDLNDDGIVNFLDLSILKASFFTDDPHADVNGDGIVNFLDLAVMSSMFFGAPGPVYVPPGVAVPAPAPWLLVLAGALAWRTARRRPRA